MSASAALNDSLWSAPGATGKNRTMPIERDRRAELRVLLAEAPVPVLLVTHDLADARRMASRILQLDAGRIVSDDPA